MASVTGTRRLSPYIRSRRAALAPIAQDTRLARLEGHIILRGVVCGPQVHSGDMMYVQSHLLIFSYKRAAVAYLAAPKAISTCGGTLAGAPPSNTP